MDMMTSKQNEILFRGKIQVTRTQETNKSQIKRLKLKTEKPKVFHSGFIICLYLVSLYLGIYEKIILLKYF